MKHYNFYTRIISRIFIDKEDKKIDDFYMKMKKTINADLKEIKRNDENNVRVEFKTRYYNILIKGSTTKAWRVYFLKDENAFVAFPTPNGNIIIQRIVGGNLFHENGTNPNERSSFWFPSSSFSYTNLRNIDDEVKDKEFVEAWLNIHTNYIDNKDHTFCKLQSI